MKTVLIGAGSLACCVALEMQRVGMKITQVYSRTREHSESLAKSLTCRWTTVIDEIISDADLYIFALSDDVLQEVAGKLKRNGGLWVHTSGCMPASIFEEYSERYGVFYPFQTFIRGRKIRLDKTPFFIETNNPEDMKMLKKIAVALSGKSFAMDSEKRKTIHLAGIFAGDFAGYLYLKATELLEEEGLGYGLLHPIIEEMADRLQTSTQADVFKNMISRQNGEIPDSLRSVIPKKSTMSEIFDFMNRHIREGKIENEKKTNEAKKNH